MKVAELMGMLEKQYPDAKYYLNFSSPLELLVASILSAQCRDETVNTTTKKLFVKYKTAKDYADTPINKLERDIKSVTFYRNKAKNIKASAMVLIERYKGQVPDKLDDLMKLPGVGRKTANIILINGFNKVEGIAVDTHVARISYRVGLTDFKDPELIEKDLMKALPKKQWVKVSHIMKSHGRAVCKPVPHCSKCLVSYLCKKQGVKKSV